MKDKIVDFFMESKFMDVLLDFAEEHPVLTVVLNGIIGSVIAILIFKYLLLNALLEQLLHKR